MRDCVDRAGASRGRGSLLTALELFAGGGGAAMGIHRAGLHTLARCEWDRDACATLRAAGDAGHIDAAEVIEGDVRAVDWSPYVGRVDLMWASPPCQAWSSAGKRLGASDDRNGWPWTFDAVDTVRPTWLLAENVTGLLMHRGDCDGKGAPDDCPGCYFHRHILPEAERRFASVQWAILNSSAFGVPQHRRRVYLVCGPRPIAWPVETHGDPAEIRQRGMFAAPLLPWVTVREALGLPLSTIGQRNPETGRGRNIWHTPDEPSPTLPAIQGGMSATESPTSIVYRRRRDGGVADETHSTDEPACALREQPGGSSQPFLLDSPNAYSNAGIRRLTVTECALLMAWPADYPLQGTKTSQYRIVGNGCTPPVVEMLTRAVIAAITRA